MAHKAPGKAHRNGISVKKLIRMFSDENKAREWLEAHIWPDGPHCPHCGSFNVHAGISHKTMTHRCRDCPDRPQFSLKTGTVMHGTKLAYSDWAIAIYILTTNLKGVSSMKLHRDLEITQKSAWHLLHRLRTSFESGDSPFQGPVEADETYIGGKRRNMSNAKRRDMKDAGRGPVGKEAVVGVKDRATNQVRATVVPVTDTAHVAGFVASQTKEGAKVYTDEAKVYNALKEFFDHESVNHSVSEYVREMAHTNGMEAFWSMLKRGYNGTYHKMSPKHLHRYVDEFSGRHNVRDADTADIMAHVANGLKGKQLRYNDLIADNGLASGARS